MINIWTSLMIALFILAFAGILYLADRISKFYILKKLTNLRNMPLGAKQLYISR